MFEPNDILNNRYQLQTLLGQKTTGHQTWLGVELPEQPLQRFWLQQVRKNLPLILFDPPNLPEYTLKFLAFSPQLQWEEVKLFEREAQVLKTLNHPKIPRYHDYFETESPRDNSLLWFALVQDYIKGHSLQELITQKVTFSEKQLKNFAKQILEILIYLHGLNPPILHRDIKPSNLILGQDNQLYLIDFGAVQNKASLTGVTFTIVGTGGYAPLEQYWGKTVPASDLYALGTTLIHLATGIVPTDLPQQNSRLQFRDYLTLSSGFIQWLETLTEFDPQDRFKSATDALKELQYLSFPSLKFLTPSSPSQSELTSEHPLNTAIKLEKDPNSITIHLPRQEKFFPSMIIMRLNHLSFNYKIGLSLSFLLISGILGFLLQQNQPQIFLLTCLISLILVGIKCLKMSQQQSLYLTHQSVKLSKRVGFIPYKIEQTNLQEIVGFFIHEAGNNQYQISMNTKKQVYFLPPISQAESNWLLQEIQSWLRKQAE